MSRLVILILAVVVASCAARGDLFLSLEPPASGQVVLYIFRTQHVPRTMDLAPGVAVNGTEVGALPLDGYLRVQVAPGSTEVRLLNRAYLWPVGAPLRAVRIQAPAGSTQFVELSVDSFRFENAPLEKKMYIGLDLRQVDQESAMRFLPKLKNSN